eukprot:4673638-Pyramimonas_sp.AAC.1
MLNVTSTELQPRRPLYEGTRPQPRIEESIRIDKSNQIDPGIGSAGTGCTETGSTRPCPAFVSTPPLH